MNPSVCFIRTAHSPFLYKFNTLSQVETHPIVVFFITQSECRSYGLIRRTMKQNQFSHSFAPPYSLRLQNAAVVVAPSHKVEHVLREYGLTNPIYVIPSGIALEQHRQRITPQECTEKRTELGVPEGSTVLLYLGRLGTEKRITELLELFSLAHQTYSNLTMLIVGDGPARKELEHLAAQLGIAEHVIFTGMVDPDEVYKYYQLGDIFVSASTSETQGLTYIEAAANGLPLLCRRDPCLDDVVIEGSNGFEYETEEEFCQILDTILHNPEWCHKASEESSHIAENFDKTSFAEKIEAVYEAVVP